MRKAVAVAWLVSITASAEAQIAPTTFDEAAYITCREANAMRAYARKQVALFLAEHSARHHGVVIPSDERGAQLTYLVRSGCTVAFDAYLFSVIDRAVLAEQDKLPRRQ